MATFFGIKPLPAGLVLGIDFANPASYSGSGSTIYDLSGKGNNASIVGTLSYSTDFGGILITPGTSGNYVGSFGPDLSSTSNTVIVGSRYAPGATQGGRVLSSGVNNWLLGHHGSNTTNCGDYYAEGWVNNPASGGGGTDWHIYTATGNIDTDSWGVYKDNSLIAENGSGSAGPNKFELGRWRTNSEYSNAQISFVLAWDRVLSADERTQVFNMYSDRFTV